MEKKEAQTREILQESNERMKQMDARTMERFGTLEERLVKSMQESNSCHDAQMDIIHDKLNRLKANIERDIGEKVCANYATWEKDRADLHAEYMLATEDIKSKLKEVDKVQDKAKEMIGMVHEARNKYNSAIQETRELTDCMEATIKKSTGQIKEWEEQMQQNRQTLDQVGKINDLIQSVKARQNEMEQVKREATNLLMDINQNKAQWRPVSSLGPQVKDAHTKLKALQKQTTKLEHNLVQAYAYWKRQWTELDERITTHNKAPEDESHLQKIADRAIKATQVAREEQFEQRMDAKVLRTVEQFLAQQTEEVNEQLRNTGDQYTAEIKEFLESAAKIQHDELIACGMQQQEALENIAAQKVKAPVRQSTQPLLIEIGLVPAQVNIPTTDSQGILSHRSVDPPGNPVDTGNQSTNMQEDHRTPTTQPKWNPYRPTQLGADERNAV